MIVGFDYQTPEIVAQELDGLMKLKPALGQYLIYGPVPGTPFHERVIKENLLQDVYTSDKDLFYRRADGFRTMMKHPTLSPAQIEDIQRWCFEQDFQRLGPSIYRVLETRFLGYLKLKDSPNPDFAAEGGILRQGIALCVSGVSAGQIARPERRRAEMDWRSGAAHPRGTGRSRRSAQQFKSVMAVGAALWTGVTLKLDLFQHPKLQRTTYRLPEKSWSAFDLWEEFQKKHPVPNFSIQVELQHAKQQVWMRLEGALSRPRTRKDWANASAIHWRGARTGWCSTSTNCTGTRRTTCRPLCEKLAAYRSRIRVVLPKLSAAHPELLLIASMFHHY